jgi:hypothetical protein
MHLYTAAVYTNGYCHGQGPRYDHLEDNERAIVHALPNILESWHYVKKQRYVDDMRREGAKVFLDSGAFSAWTLGVKLSVREYCEYIQQNRDILRIEDGDLMASVLDGIGDPLATYRNQLEMEERGVRPLPCFHFGEDPTYLEHYVRNYTYITIGGMVGKSAVQLQNWLDVIFEKYICDGTGRARLKVHGFGMTSIPLMWRYPWYSTDSSSWIQATSFGSVVIPERKAGLREIVGPVKVSENSPGKHVAGQHILNHTELEAGRLKKCITDLGFNLERLATVYESRAAFNLMAYNEINKIINSEPTERFVPDKTLLFPELA